MKNSKLKRLLATGLDPRPSTKELDALWAKAVKLRDGNKSVWSDKTTGLNAHHILKKPNHRLRWELDNGITITQGEHKYIAHGPGNREEDFKEWALSRLGKARRQTLEMMKRQTGSVDLWAVRIYLTQKIAEFS